MAEGSSVPGVVFGRSGGEATNPRSPTWELRQYAERQRNALVEEREPYIPDMQQVAEYVDPTRGRFNEVAPGGPSGASGPGNARNRRNRSKIINNTATICVRTASAGFSSHMTSKSRPWFQVESPDQTLNDVYDVRVWMETVTTAIRDVLARSNFYRAMPDSYTENLMFGSTAMLMPEHDEEVVRFHTLTAGTFALGLDADGKVASLYRVFSRTARQLKDAYGEDNLPENVKTACREAPGRYFQVQALIEKNPDEKPGMGPLGLQAAKYRPWREILWMTGTSDAPHGILKLNGYYEQPFNAGRFNPAGDEVYSSGPCLDSLGDIKQLQYLEGKKLKIYDQISDPPLGLPSSMRNRPASLAPGSKTYLPDTQVGVEAKPLYSPNPNAAVALSNEIREVEARIQNCLFYPLFLMLASLDDRDRTATEIAERRDERATVLGPTVEVVTDEQLDPTIVRVFRVLERRGQIPPAPPALANIPLKIEYTSILAQAMKAAGLTAIERTIGFAASIVAATKDPSHFDKVDFDQSLDEFSSRVAAPATMIRSDEAVAQIREGRARQQQAAQLAAMAKPAADAANAYKTLATTVPEDGSAAEALAGVIGGGQ